MGKFRKKPVEVEAFQFDGCSNTDPSVPMWFVDAVHDRKIVAFPEHIEVHTLEGVMRAYPGDWIIQGVKGELYPCKADIFAATYDAVLDHEALEKNRLAIEENRRARALMGCAGLARA